MPWNQERWLLGMIVAHRYVLKRHFYDIEWYSPNGKTALLCSYNDSDVSVFIRRFEELKRGEPPNEYLYCEPYITEIIGSGE